MDLPGEHCGGNEARRLFCSHDDARLIAHRLASLPRVIRHMSEITAFLMLHCKELAAVQKQDKLQPE
jgi:hypothetical protein